MLMQLEELRLSDNRLGGRLPETWSNLASVSFTIGLLAAE